MIARENVRWTEAEGDYVRLHTADGSAYLVRIPISHLEERWSGFSTLLDKAQVRPLALRKLASATPRTTA